MANGAIRDDATKHELATYLHASAFSPVTSTFDRAIIRGHYTTWPGISSSLITKHLEKSTSTSKGHLRMQQKNTKSTKVIAAPIDTDIAPPQEKENKKTQNVFVIMQDTKELNRSYSDQTGRFPVQSSRGNNYVMVVYSYDSNAILTEALPNRQGSVITKAWQKTHDRLKENGYAPSIHILDNECSQDLKKAFKKNNIDFQRVPPHSHRRNAAERAIQTWKNHFIAGLSSCDPNFPLSEWDHLLPQAELTLNLLRSSRRQPKLSAHACLFGNYDFNRCPLAPPGTKVIIFETPEQRRTYAPHGIDGWYVGPSLEHYRCYKCFVPATQATRDTETVDWFPHAIKFPKVSNDDYLKQTATDMLTLLKEKRKQNKTLTYGDPIRNAYAEIAQILTRATEPPPLPPAVEPRVLIPPTPTPTEEPRVLLPPAPQAIHQPVQQTQSPNAAEPRVITSPNPRASPLMTPSTPPRKSRQQIPTVTPPRAPTIRRAAHIPVPRRLNTNSRYGAAIDHIAAEATIPKNYSHHIAALAAAPPASGKQPTLTTLLKGPEADIWTRSTANEWGRLLEHGTGLDRPPEERIKGTGTLFFVAKSQIPEDRKATYANFICTIRPQKKETHRVRMTAGGDQLDYPGDASSPTVAITDAKVHVNSTISDARRGARYVCMDVQNFYLGTPMSYYQYIRVRRHQIPQEIWDDPRYTIIEDKDGWIYLEIRRGMYGLKEAGIIAFKQLVNKLEPSGYHPMQHTPGLWRHKTRKTTFALCVDDFGVKYFSKADALHLINALETEYKLTIDWTGSLYCGLNLDWHYTASPKPYVEVSMDGYGERALKHFDHPAPDKPQHAPHAWIAPVYGRKTAQMPTPDPDEPTLDKKGSHRVQSVSGKFLYYSNIDYCIKPALNEISSQQAKPTKQTTDKCNMLMDYIHTYPNAVLRFYASDMILNIESDAAYLVLPKARSRGAVHFFFGNDPKVKEQMDNAPFHVLCQTIKGVMSSAAEAETGGIYMGGKVACPLRIAAIELGHPQPPDGSPFKTDNSTAHGILTSNMRQKLSKAFDMKFYWMKDRISQKQFDLIWAKGILNKADYFTKHHPPWHHKKMRYKYLQRIAQLHHAFSALKCADQWRGCVTPGVLSRHLEAMLH